jgi:erythromycin esterase
MGPIFRLAPVAIVFLLLPLSPGLVALSQAEEIDSTSSPRRAQGRLVRDNEILPGIYLIDGIDAPLPTYDLRALGDLIGDAQVVGLGESIHTSGGYYQAKHRVFRYLVEELGFRVFAFESPWFDAEQVREFVETCNGNSWYPVTRGLFGVWAAQSVRDLVEWMCAFNQANPDDPVAFWGFDIQQPWDDGRLLVEYLERAVLNPAAFIEDIEHCNGVGSEDAYDYYTDPAAQEITEEDHLECLNGLARLEAFFDSREDILVARTSPDELEWARINLVGLRSWENSQYYFMRDDYEMAMQSRDEGMAYVFQVIKQLRNPDDRAAIWAHNWHIAFDTQNIPAYENARSMGTYLRDDFGDAYFVLGLVGYDVSINWPGVGSGPLPPPPSPAHVEYLLHHEIERDFLLVDLDFGGTDEPFLLPGQLYALNHWALVPAEHFDALLYLDVSPPMDALLWRDP